MTEIERVKNSIAKLTEEQNNLIIRICGLSDPLLEIQAREEYELLTVQLAELNEKYNQLTIEQDVKLMTKNINDTLSEMKQELQISYYNQYIKIDNINTKTILAVLEQTNYSGLTDKIMMSKVRLPNSLADRRQFALIADILESQITIYDLEGKILDMIGKSKYNKSLALYIYELSRYCDDLDYTKCALAIPK